MTLLPDFGRSIAKSVSRVGCFNRISAWATSELVICLVGGGNNVIQHLPIFGVSHSTATIRFNKVKIIRRE
jgi:hypothetical protein